MVDGALVQVGLVGELGSLALFHVLFKLGAVLAYSCVFTSTVGAFVLLRVGDCAGFVVVVLATSQAFADGGFA